MLQVIASRGYSAVFWNETWIYVSSGLELKKETTVTWYHRWCKLKLMLKPMNNHNTTTHFTRARLGQASPPHTIKDWHGAGHAGKSAQSALRLATRHGGAVEYARHAEPLRHPGRPAWRHELRLTRPLFNNDNPLLNLYCLTMKIRWSICCQFRLVV